MSTPPSLHIPAEPDEDSLLEAFTDWVEARGVELYEAQEEAILELLSGNHVVLNTPTGSGKSLVAVAAHFAAFAAGERSVYTSPIKALVSEKFFDLCAVFGAEHVGMLTGDGAVNAEAPILCCTAEILSSMALRNGDDTGVDVVVMDEFHYYGDRDRGAAWQIPLLVLTHARFLLMSATLGDPEAHAARLMTATDRPAVVVRSDQRPVPLEFEYALTPLLETLEKLVSKDRAPVYLVSFSQREANDLAQSLISSNFIDKERRSRLREVMGGFRFDTPFGKKLKRAVEHGVGIHHAGLLPKYRRLVEKLAQTGLLTVISGTDTLGVGVNVPIRTVLFTRLYKYDGVKSRILSVRDFKQIAGRAGRRGYDDKGWVVVQAPSHTIENARREAKVASGQMNKKKFKREQPPKGYIQYNPETYEQLLEGRPEPVKPSLSLSTGMVLEVLQRDPENCGKAGGFGRILDLIDRSHGGPTDKVNLKRQAEQRMQALVDAGVLKDPGTFVDGPMRLVVHLQDEFSVFHSLSLFVLNTVEALPYDQEDYALRILSLVESILESPKAILRAQAHRDRGEAIAAMKAEGMEYEERMAALEDIEHPKPEADWLYGVFNEYVSTRPWLEAEHLRPKGIAREMLEAWAPFAQYVRDLHIEGVEGVLLRYLGQVYKLLIRTIPEHELTDELIDLIARLRTTIAQADSSLLAEWEAMLEPPEPGAAPVPVTPKPNKKALLARARAELHEVLRALATGDFDVAAMILQDAEPDVLKSSLQALELERVRVDPAARQANQTVVREQEPWHWAISQQLLDLDGEVVGTLDGFVDVRDGVPEGPLVVFDRLS